MTIYDAPEQFGAEKRSNHDPEDKFESPFAAYRRKDPQDQEPFSEVGLGDEWPGRAGRRGIGIDIAVRVTVKSVRIVKNLPGLNA